MAAITFQATPNGYYTRVASAQATTGQTDWFLIPDWAVYCWVMLDLTAVAGTTPVVTPSFVTADPVSLDDANVIRLAEHGNYTGITAAAQYIFQFGPNVTGIANDTTNSATADSYSSLNVALPGNLGVTLTLDRAEADETYTYNLIVMFRR